MNVLILMQNLKMIIKEIFVHLKEKVVFFGIIQINIYINLNYEKNLKIEKY